MTLPRRVKFYFNKISDPTRMFSLGDKYQLMAKSCLRDGTKPVVFVSEVAKQHDVHVFTGIIAFGVLVSAHASF